MSGDGESLASDIPKLGDDLCLLSEMDVFLEEEEGFEERVPGRWQWSWTQGLL